MTKTCKHCGESKPIEEFHKLAKSPDGKDHRCKPCKRAYDNQYYKKTPKRQKAIRISNNKRRTATLDWVRSYLGNHPCVDCGEADIVVLEFDHTHSKDSGVAELLRRGTPLKRVQSEIAKCEVRCCNCHRRKTAQTLGSWRLE